MKRVILVCGAVAVAAVAAAIVVVAPERHDAASDVARESRPQQSAPVLTPTPLAIGLSRSESRPAPINSAPPPVALPRRRSVVAAAPAKPELSGAAILASSRAADVAPSGDPAPADAATGGGGSRRPSVRRAAGSALAFGGSSALALTAPSTGRGGGFAAGSAATGGAGAASAREASAATANAVETAFELPQDVPFPAALAEDGESLSPEAGKANERIVEGFQQQIDDATGQPDETQALRNAQELADAQYRALFGDAAYNDRALKAALEARASPGAQ